MAKLAINGADPLCKKEFPGWPWHDEQDEQVLYDVYQSGTPGTAGEQTKRFARRFAQYNGAKYCIPVANGTVSIELIMRGLGLSRGDEVILPAYTFIASLSALIYAGVTPVFADIDENTLNLSAQSVAEKITPRTRVVMPVYVGGRPADLDRLGELCQQHGLYLIGDAAQAAGSQWKGKGVGSYGMATSFSCQNSKNLNCGEGGIITTNDDALYQNITTMISGGKNAAGQVVGLALDSGISDYQAGILNTQFDHLEEQITRRMENAARLDALLSSRPYASPLVADDRITRNSYHLYCLRLNTESLGGVSRESFVNAVAAEGVPLGCGYGPVYEFDCVSGEYAKKQVGRPIDTSLLKVTDRVGHQEGCWFYHAVLLAEEGMMQTIVDAMDKVYENLDELR